MSLGTPARWFLTAAVVHLAAAATLLVLGPWDQALNGGRDGLVWLLLIGFVGFTVIGFSLHLFPPFSRRLSPGGRLEMALFPLAEAAVIVGTWTSGWREIGGLPKWTFAIAAGLYVLVSASFLYRFARMIESPRVRSSGPAPRPGGAVTVPLFLSAFVAAPAAGALFLTSAFSYGPGFGWWLAGVHLLVLGYAVVLIVAVSLRLLPRLFAADPPRRFVYGLSGLGVLGGVAVPVGMLVSTPSAPGLLEVLALPEAALAVGIVVLFSYLGWTARTPRPQLSLYLVSVSFFATGGTIGLYMVSRMNYAYVDTHAFVGVLGFIGLIILLMWFAMIAPFQRISHAWTRRMLWTLAIAWIVAVLAVATVGLDTSYAGWLSPLAGVLLLGVAVAWGAGTLPVLYPGLNPLPGLTRGEIEVIRDRWKNR